MTRTKPDDARDYLLGQLPEDEKDALERGYFADPARVDHVAAAESDLLDAYLEGALGADERADFESHYLASPVHRDRLDTATRLRLAAAASHHRPPVPWAGLAAAAVLALAVSVWWTASPPEPRTATGPSPVPAPTAIAPAAEPPEAPPAPWVPKPTVALALSAVRVRGGEATPQLRLAAGVDEVQLELHGDARPTADAYWYALRTVEGTEITTGLVRPDGEGTHALVRIRASLLAPDDYIVAVYAGAEGPIAQYYFRVLP